MYLNAFKCFSHSLILSANCALRIVCSISACFRRFATLHDSVKRDGVKRKTGFNFYVFALRSSRQLSTTERYISLRFSQFWFGKTSHWPVIVNFFIEKVILIILNMKSFYIGYFKESVVELLQLALLKKILIVLFETSST